ncbi:MULTISPECIES: RbsD/FucU family protein [Microbacterium]|uniref:RbsD/FucU family protein n=1 Tax=Microbacterium TaxID=33882 RepID=UPI00217E7D5E|nr:MULTISPECIES: RbsD/FucU domain-containing protein [Microbacterium]UWF77340.1 transport protein RbsD/FucU [Microbacterium neungamense]WCM55499.1 transport protein RbsD/FucU [Microbacterium sp. EF45047]
MLEGIHPLLTGELLLHLDRMGHSDAVVVADAHFPAWALGTRVIDLPGTTTPEVVAAIRTVLPLDDAPAMDLMESADGEVLEVQRELMDAAGTEVGTTRFVERFAYYDVAKGAYLMVRTGETRKYGNALLRKGVVGHPAG